MTTSQNMPASLPEGVLDSLTPEAAQEVRDAAAGSVAPRRTYRERREARAARRREWAEGREAKAAEAFAAGDLREERSGIPFGQPILVGHHSQRRHERAIERAESAMRRGFEHEAMADRHERSAATIEHQLATSIYDDDPDAIERLEAKLAGLEGERDRVKAYNASCRRAAKTGGVGDLELLDEKQRADLVGTMRACPYMIGLGGKAPAYLLSNLGGNITRTRKRLEELQRRAAS